MKKVMDLKKITKISIREISHFFFPYICFYCNKIDALTKKISICKECFEFHPEDYYSTEFCKICKSELNGLSECEFCSSRNVFFDRLEFVQFRGNFQSVLLKEIKFNNNRNLTKYFRLGIKKKLKFIEKENLNSFFLIPSSKSSLKDRPFHPAESIVPIILKKLKIQKFCPVEKVTNQKQSDNSYHERFHFAQESFRIKKVYTNKLSGNILIVDDVFTTGASMNEIARICKKNGAKKIIALTFLKNKKKVD